MVEILPPLVPDPPAYDPDADTCVSVQPWPHARYMDDFEYYDQLGRDPFQQYRIWSTEDPAERVAMLQRVLEKYPKQRHRRQMLFDASVRGDEAIVRCLVNTGLRVHPDMQQLQVEIDNSSDDDSDGSDQDDPTATPLHIAAAGGKFGCVKIFIESGVEVDIRDELGQTPLISVASGCCDPDIIRYLLNAGANPTARTYADDSPAEARSGHIAGADALEMATGRGNVETLKLLLESMAKTEENRDKHLSALITPLAIKQAALGGVEALTLLLDKAAYPTEDKDGKTKAELLSTVQRQTIEDATPPVIEFGSLESLKLLLSYQYPVDKVGNVLPFEVTEALRKPFVWGAYNAMAGRPDKFEFIYNLGVKEHESMSLDGVPEGQTMNIQHLLERAVENGSIDCVRLLIEKYGAQPDQSRMPPCVQPLYHAASNNQTDMVRYLLENHAPDLHLGSGRYATGPTALWIAIRLKALGSIALLLQHGGPLDHIDHEIQTITQPLNTIMWATCDDRDRPTVRFEVHPPDREDFDIPQGDFRDRNPRYVRVKVGPADTAWIQNLQLRRPYEELRETGDDDDNDCARMFDTVEEAHETQTQSLDESDIRRLLVSAPTVEWREKELAKDDDLLPAWESCVVEVNYNE